MHDIAKNIKVLRKRCGLNQTQLAEKIHVTRQAISSWERGLSCPDLHTLMELSQIFNVEIDQIIYSPSGEQKKPKRVTPLSPKFIIASVLIYFLLFHFGGAYIAIPIFKKICGGGISEEFIFLIYWGLLLLVTYIAICTCLIIEYITSLGDEVESPSPSATSETSDKEK